VASLAQDLERLYEIREQIAELARNGDAGQQERLRRIDELVAEREGRSGTGGNDTRNEAPADGAEGVGATSGGEISSGSVWAGLWEGDIRVQNSYIRAQMALGARSWVDFGGQCRASLAPVSISGNTAVFNFE